MNRSRILVPSFVCLAAVLLIAADGSVKNHVPRSATRDAVMNYVKEAAAVVQKLVPRAVSVRLRHVQAGEGREMTPLPSRAVSDLDAKELARASTCD